MKFVFYGILMFVASSTFAQKSEIPDFDAVDSLYREDQFYFSFTYNILTNKNEGFSQNKFSAGLTGGFLRDFPLNKKRDVSVAVGFGYAFSSYNFNLIAKSISNEISYRLPNPDDNYSKNRLITHSVELPIEFRWRTSTFESHKFWRVYTGVKLSYLFFDKSIYSDKFGETIVRQNQDLEKLRYGIYIAAGYNTWNATVYYGLNPLYKKGTLNGEPIDLTTLNVGLMFYIL